MFSTPSSKMSINVYKLRHELCNGQNFLPWNPSFREKKILLSNFTNQLGNFSTNLKPYYREGLKKYIYILLSTLSSKRSGNIVKCVTNCVTPKRALVLPAYISKTFVYVLCLKRITIMANMFSLHIIFFVKCMSANCFQVYLIDIGYLILCDLILIL